MQGSWRWTTFFEAASVAFDTSAEQKRHSRTSTYIQTDRHTCVLASFLIFLTDWLTD